MFITLEGSEGSGKTSHMQPLAKYLQESGFQVLVTREPGGTPIGDQIRGVLFDFKNSDMDPRTEVLLLQASRAQLVERLIRPHLQGGGVVLCDRFADSTLAYQGYGYQRDVNALRKIVEYATCGLKPDLTLFLDVEVEAGLRRRARGGSVNRLDVYPPEFYQRVRQGYLEMAQAEPERWVVVDANQPWEQVHKELRRVIAERLAIA